MTVILNTVLISSLLTVLHLTVVFCFIRQIIPNHFSPIAIHVGSAILNFTLLFSCWIFGVLFDFWSAFCILTLVTSVYLFLFSAVYKSLSLRFLLLIREKNNCLSVAGLTDAITNVSFLERIQLLQEMGLIEEKSGMFHITPRGKVMADKIKNIKSIFGIKTVGLYREN